MSSVTLVYFQGHDIWFSHFSTLILKLQHLFPIIVCIDVASMIIIAQVRFLHFTLRFPVERRQLLKWFIQKLVGAKNWKAIKSGKGKELPCITFVYPTMLLTFSGHW